MIAETNEIAATTANCPRCHGTGSGLYNVVSLDSTCEACEGTGHVAPSAPQAIAHPPHAAARPRSVRP